MYLPSICIGPARCFIILEVTVYPKALHSKAWSRSEGGSSGALPPPCSCAAAAPSQKQPNTMPKAREPHAPKGGFYWSFHRTHLALILKLPREKVLPRTAHRYEEWPRVYEMTNQFHLISCCRWRNGLVQQSYQRWTPLKICFLIFSSWWHSCLVQHIHQRPTPSPSNSKRSLTSLSICLSHRRERRK